MAIFRKSASAKKGMSPFKAGLLAIVLVVVGTYFAYTKANPFADPFEFSATFTTASTLEPDAEVRIAGIEVGIVKEVAPVGTGGDAATVTMEIEDHGLPIHTDAELRLTPNIFLEGNEFVEIEPGSPSAPLLEDGETIPVNQTSTPVQFGQVLSVLESDTREDLKTFLQEYSLEALKGGGAKSFNNAVEYWEEAYRNSAIANEALLGTQPGDLFRVLRGQQRTFAALSSQPEELKGLISNFNTTMAAFAAEDDALQATVPALRDVLAVGRPALASLNSTLPDVQQFAVGNDLVPDGDGGALPAVRSSQTTIPESFPFIHQLRELFAKDELRGLADDLRKTIPALARVNKRTIPLLNQNRALSACTNDVLLPFARTPIPTGDPGPEPADDPNVDPDATVTALDFPYDPNSTGQPFVEQSSRSFVGLSGESRTTDGNGKFFRANFKLDNALTVFRPGTSLIDPVLVALAGIDEEARPAPPPLEQGNEQFGYRRPVFRPDFPCEKSVTPDLRAPSATQQAAGAGGGPGQVLGTVEDLEEELGGLLGGAVSEADIQRILDEVTQTTEDGGDPPPLRKLIGELSAGSKGGSREAPGEEIPEVAPDSGDAKDGD